MATIRQSAEAVAATLARLYDLEFGGKQNGRYRISRKFFHEIAGRRRVTDEFMRSVADELFEAGFVLIDLGTYVAVISQSLTNNYRHVTKHAVAEVLEPPIETADTEPRRTKTAGAPRTKRTASARKSTYAEIGKI